MQEPRLPQDIQRTPENDERKGHQEELQGVLKQYQPFQRSVVHHPEEGQTIPQNYLHHLRLPSSVISSFSSGFSSLEVILWNFSAAISLLKFIQWNFFTGSNRL